MAKLKRNSKPTGEAVTKSTSRFARVKSSASESIPFGRSKKKHNVRRSIFGFLGIFGKSSKEDIARQLSDAESREIEGPTTSNTQQEHSDDSIPSSARTSLSDIEPSLSNFLSVSSSTPTVVPSNPRRESQQDVILDTDSVSSSVLASSSVYSRPTDDGGDSVTQDPLAGTFWNDHLPLLPFVDHDESPIWASKLRHLKTLVHS